MLEQPPKYGEKHREEKRKKLQKTDNACQISGVKKGTGELHAHHSQPKSLGFFDKGDMESNYIIMLDEYHKRLHDVCKQDDKLLSERYQMAKRVWNNPEDNQAMERLKELDDELIPAFIDGLMNKLAFRMREIVVQKTLENGFKTNRDLKIEVHSLEKRVDALESEVERLRQLIERKIVHISEYQVSHPSIYE